MHDGLAKGECHHQDLCFAYDQDVISTMLRQIGAW